MAENRIACCYLTYNHKKTVEHVLSNMISSYKDHGIDIYIYDSSEDDETELIVKKYKESGFDNIFYVDVRFIKSGDEKYLYVIQGNGLQHHYDYIWPSKDRCFLAGKTLDDIVSATKEGYDVIMAADEEERWELRWPPIKDVYTDPVEFFSHYGQLSTDWMGILRKTSTMVDSVDWEELVKTYGLGRGHFFNQTVSLFACLAKLSAPQIKVVHISFGEMLNSVYSVSEWMGSFMEVWWKKWIPSIYSLPSVYDGYKLSVIKSQLGLPQLFGSTETLMYLKSQGMFTEEVLQEMKPLWSMITDLPLRYAELIVSSKEPQMLEEITASFSDSFSKKDYDTAYFIYKSNPCLRQVLKDEDYNDLEACFSFYRQEINNRGYSVLFNEIDSADSLLKKYRAIRDRDK